MVYLIEDYPERPNFIRIKNKIKIELDYLIVKFLKQFQDLLEFLNYIHL
jgi:hypothetical protein